MSETTSALSQFSAMRKPQISANQHLLGFCVMMPAATTDVTHKIIMFFSVLFVPKKRTRDDLSPSTSYTKALANMVNCAKAR